MGTTFANLQPRKNLFGDLASYREPPPDSDCIISNPCVIYMWVNMYVWEYNPLDMEKMKQNITSA